MNLQTYSQSLYSQPVTIIRLLYTVCVLYFWGLCTIIIIIIIITGQTEN